jgi:hypothetical protein
LIRHNCWPYKGALYHIDFFAEFISIDSMDFPCDVPFFRIMLAGELLGAVKNGNELPIENWSARDPGHAAEHNFMGPGGTWFLRSQTIQRHHHVLRGLSHQRERAEVAEVGALPDPNAVSGAKGSYQGASS